MQHSFFQGGVWIGIELDTPTGKNDGTVQGNTYFTCKPKHGLFVRADKLIHDKRGKAMRAYKAEKLAAAKGELMGFYSGSMDDCVNHCKGFFDYCFIIPGNEGMTRSKSRGESLNTVGLSTMRK